MDTVIKNAAVIQSGPLPSVLTNAWVGIKDGKIAAVSSDRSVLPPAKNVIDGRSRTLMPGLINAHAHSPMIILRGFADDCELDDWLFNHVFPVEERWTGEGIYLSTLYSIGEMLRNGITSVSDMYYFCDDMARAYEQGGIKVNISRSCTWFKPDFNEKAQNLKEVQELFEKWHRFDNGRIIVEDSIHSEYTTTPELCSFLAKHAYQNNIGMHVHVSESEKELNECIERHGMTPTAYLDSLGVFDTRVNVAHGVWLTEHDMEILACKEASVSHNPVSNLKLASGIADIEKLQRYGVNVALGTDSVCSNNSIDLFEEMKLAAILQKGITRRGGVMSAAQAFRMATLGGAAAQGREHECGTVEVGKDADLILVDDVFPVHSRLSNIVYANHGSDVLMTMVRGRILYQEGKFSSIDMESAKREITEKVLPAMFPKN